MRWMKIRDACAYLGGISADTLYAATARGECRVARIGAGRNLLWCEEWLDQYAVRLAEHGQPHEVMGRSMAFPEKRRG